MNREKLCDDFCTGGRATFMAKLLIAFTFITLSSISDHLAF